MIITTSQGEAKVRWLAEVNQYVNDPLTLHEHSVDDLRIDSTQVKPDSEYENFHLPIQRKASYESDGIRPSEVAKDYFLTEEERAYYAKQHAEDQRILEQQQKEFIEQKSRVTSKTSTTTQVQTQAQAQAQTQVQSKTQAKTQTQIQTQTQTQVQSKTQVQSEKTTETAEIPKVAAVAKVAEITKVEQVEQVAAVQSTQKESTQVESSVKVKAVDKHGRLSRGEAIEQSTEIRTQTQAQLETKQEQSEVRKKSVDEQQRQSVVEVTKEKAIVGAKQEIQITDKVENSAQFVQKKAGKTEQIDIKQIQIVVSSGDSVNQVKFDINDTKLTIAATDTNQLPNKMHDGDNPNALDMHTSQMPSGSPRDAAGNAPNQTNANTEHVTATPNNQIALNESQPTHRLQTISIFNFGDRAGAPGQPPVPNLPDFLVPPHLITYETSIEINFRKIPPPQPPPPPKFIKKMLVHTESLERRTRAFLTGNFEVGTTDSALRTARQKIRSLKSTILKSDDEVKHAEDTIHKAQSGDFLNIFAPPIVEQPLYEFIEVPSQRSEDECSENLDRRSERSQSVQQQELENMEDYYSSKYSSRSSRRRVEGNSDFRFSTRKIDNKHVKCLELSCNYSCYSMV